MPDLQLAGFMSRELFQPHTKKRAWLDEKVFVLYYALSSNHR